MARTESLWQERQGGYIEPSDPNGFNILVRGTNKYINFADISGSSGYGIRDNAGVMEVKNYGGAWAAIGAPDLSAYWKNDGTSGPATGDWNHGAYKDIYYTGNGTNAIEVRNYDGSQDRVLVGVNSDDRGFIKTYDEFGGLQTTIENGIVTSLTGAFSTGVFSDAIYDYSNAKSLDTTNRIAYANDGVTQVINYSDPATVVFGTQISTTGIYNASGASPVYIGYGIMQDSGFFTSADFQNRQLHNLDSSIIASWGNGHAFYATLDGTRSVYLDDGTYAINALGIGLFNNSIYTAEFVTGANSRTGRPGAGTFYDGTNEVDLADGTYAVNAVGSSLFTGSVNIETGNLSINGGYINAGLGINGGGLFVGDGTGNSVYLASDGSYAINATGTTYLNGITIIGTSTPNSAQLTVDANANPYAINTTGTISATDVSSNIGQLASGSYGVVGNKGTGGIAGGYFDDGASGNIVYLADGTYAINATGPTHFTDVSGNTIDLFGINGDLYMQNVGGNVAALNSSGRAGHFTGTAGTVDLVDGIYAVHVFGGGIMLDDGSGMAIYFSVGTTGDMSLAGTFAMTTMFTFATLPTGVAQGTEAYINDASIPIWHAAASGGGSDFSKVVWDGTQWIYA